MPAPGPRPFADVLEDELRVGEVGEHPAVGRAHLPPRLLGRREVDHLHLGGPQIPTGFPKQEGCRHVGRRERVSEKDDALGVLQLLVGEGLEAPEDRPLGHGRFCEQRRRDKAARRQVPLDTLLGGATCARRIAGPVLVMHQGIHREG